MKVEEILQEIESMAMLDHPNVIKASSNRSNGTQESCRSSAALSCGPFGMATAQPFRKHYTWVVQVYEYFEDKESVSQIMELDARPPGFLILCNLYPFNILYLRLTSAFSGKKFHQSALIPQALLRR